jgi:hypothetical protein
MKRLLLLSLCALLCLHTACTDENVGDFKKGEGYDPNLNVGKAAPPLPMEEALRLLRESNERYALVMKGGMGASLPFEKDQVKYIALGADLNSEDKIKAYLQGIYTQETIDRIIQYMSLSIVNGRYAMQVPDQIELVDFSSITKLDSVFADSIFREYRTTITYKEKPREIKVQYAYEDGRWLLSVAAGEFIDEASPLNMNMSAAEAEAMLRQLSGEVAQMKTDAGDEYKEDSLSLNLR